MLFVQRVARPQTFRRTLVSGEPSQRLLQVDVLAGKARLFERERDEASGVPVAFHFQRRAVGSFPCPDKGTETPASIGLLSAQGLVYDRLLLCGREESRHFGRRPQKDHPIDEGLPGVFTVKVLAEQCKTVLDFGGGAIVLGRGTHRDGGEGGSVELRVVRFPRFVMEPQPRPRTLGVSRRLLESPHVVES